MALFVYSSLGLLCSLHFSTTFEVRGLPSESSSFPSPLFQPGGSLGISSSSEGKGLQRDVWLPAHKPFTQPWAHTRWLCPVNTVGAPFYLLGAFPIQEEVAMEAALTFVPVAIILTVDTHSFIFTRTLCHPVFNLAKEGQGDHKKA